VEGQEVSIDVTDIIDRLPWELAARLQADPFFVDIPVVVVEEGNVLQEMEKKQAAVTTQTGHRGVAVFVLEVIADDDQRSIQFGPMTLRPAFQVVENVELNRDANGTGKSVRKVSRKIVQVMKLCGMGGLITSMIPDKPCIEPVNLKKELGDGIKARQVNFYCMEVPGQVPGQVQIPVFVSLAPLPQFTITCATAGAQIYYTTDDSYPAGGNATTVAYVAGEPINIPAGGMTVRAAAYVNGMIASSVARAYIAASVSK
jgi:hypothetical protein